MTDTLTMNFRHLCFTGPRKKPAVIEFSDGLNIVFGPSNTGKSSILDAIDFMMGRERKLKEIPEHVGYSDISLGLEFSDQSKFTVVRSIDGGHYKLFSGLHNAPPEDQEFQTLREKNSTKKEQSLSDFILERIGLAGKLLKRNARNDKEKLSIRTLLPIFVVDETNIQTEGSPFMSGQFTKRTSETSRLKLLLTGVDDSSLVSEKTSEAEKISRSARAGLLDDLIQDMRTKILSVASKDTTIDELRDQESKLNGSIEQANTSLQAHQKGYYEALSARNSDRKQLHEKTERLSEVKSMRKRFNILLSHYLSDVERLDGIIESGALVSALSDEICPLCGATPENQDPDHACDGDIDSIVQAAQAEKSKVLLLHRDLSRTLEQLSMEEQEVDGQIVAQRAQLDESQKSLNLLEPDFTQSRTDYSELISKKSQVSKAIGLFETLEDLQTRFQSPDEGETPDKNTDSTKVPAVALYDLAQEIEKLLEEWNLPNADNVHFSDDEMDIVINGKHRASNGKGHRSITHSATSIGLARLLERKSLPRPGFVILDSPLIAYEEPDEDDEVSQTDLNEKFFADLQKWNSTQTIIFENKKSITPNIMNYGRVTQFTKSETHGRYGFFPL
ncbi:AAA family ATPase [Leisingera caerulea]|uniref:AAA family ATPase n=1 Tax=Leisingera caerulea TaxID=506591 RepID=UPI000684A8DB|nr:AAA family ATPase [Leisingera caerulea]